MGSLLEGYEKSEEFEEFGSSKEGCEEIIGNNGVIMVSVEEIMPNKAQPRRVFDNSALMELSESVRKYGVIQPVVVRKCEERAGSVFKYELVAGERRLRACKMAGMSVIPCVLVEVNEEQSAELAIIENLHRRDLNIFEMAEAIMSLIEIYGFTQEEIAEKLSVTQSAVANKLRLLRLSDEERRIVVSNGLTERHARGLLRVSDDATRMRVLERILERNMNVKAAEAYIECVLRGFAGKNGDEDGECVAEEDKKYVNVIQKAIEKLRRRGIEAKSTCTETDDFYIYTITVDKR